MHRVTVTLDDDLMAELDALIARRGDRNRSEAVRDLARAGLRQMPGGEGEGACVAALIYVFDHAARDLARRLTHSGHDRRDLSVATLHVHLDRDTCLEVSVLRGEADEVRHHADHVIAERGVRHGRLVMLPAPPQP